MDNSETDCEKQPYYVSTFEHNMQKVQDAYKINTSLSISKLAGAILDIFCLFLNKFRGIGK